MTINITANNLTSAFNNSDPNSLSDRLRAIKFGNVLRQQLQINMWQKALDGAAGTNPYVVLTAQTLTLPDDAKAQGIMCVVARSGTGTTATQLTVDLSSSTEPAAGHCKVSPSGDLVFQHVDAWTSLDITYFPDVYDIYEFSVPVVSNLLTLPTGLYGTLLLEAQILTGTTIGSKVVDLPGTAQATGHASLNAAGTQVLFGTGDAALTARVKVGVKPAFDLNAQLELASIYI